jgi:hypothetical protein
VPPSTGSGRGETFAARRKALMPSSSKHGTSPIQVFAWGRPKSGGDSLALPEVQPGAGAQMKWAAATAAAQGLKTAAAAVAAATRWSI